MNRESWLSSLQPGDTAVEVASGTTMPVTVIECKKSRIWYVPGTRAIWHDSPVDAPQARCVRADTGVAGDASRHLIPNDKEDGCASVEWLEDPMYDGALWWSEPIVEPE